MPGPVVKTSWPEVLGMPNHEAQDIIRNDRPDLRIEVQLAGGGFPPPLVRDYRRVIIYVNPNARLTVARVPVVG